LAVPGVVLAFGYLAMTSRIRWLAWLDPVTADPTILLVIAYVMRRLPLAVRAITAGLEQLPVNLELASMNLGASYGRTVRRIVVPLLSGNLIAAALMIFSFSVLEVSDSLILAQRTSDYPVTKAIYELTSRLGDGPFVAAAMGVWAMALLTITLLVSSRLLGRRLGMMFRF